jgi:hypothetical protein
MLTSKSLHFKAARQKAAQGARTALPTISPFPTGTLTDHDENVSERFAHQTWQITE